MAIPTIWLPLSPSNQLSLSILTLQFSAPVFSLLLSPLSSLVCFSHRLACAKFGRQRGTGLRKRKNPRGRIRISISNFPELFVYFDLITNEQMNEDGLCGLAESAREIKLERERDGDGDGARNRDKGVCLQTEFCWESESGTRQASRRLRILDRARFYCSEEPQCEIERSLPKRGPAKMNLIKFTMMSIND